MVTDFIASKILEELHFEPTKGQSNLILKLSEFVCSTDDGIFLLNGYAGTGKTSVISALIKVLSKFDHHVALLAPTGRAAKVLSSYSGKSAFTIHRRIYRQATAGDINAHFSANTNLHRDTLFVVDEASMISNTAFETTFGSGCLLDDLIEYIYSQEGCRLILVGDSAQLPPIGQTISPALDSNVLKGYGFDITECNLTEVVRQTYESGILYNATKLRYLMLQGEIPHRLPQLELNNYADIVKVNGDELIEELSTAYSNYGTDETIIISRSNKRANIINNGVRNRILYREEEISSGDMVMVVKNNYFWSKNIEGMDFIANGDVAQIKRIRNVHELYGFHFADATLFFPDYNVEIDAKILSDTLQSEAPALTREENERLFTAVEADYADIGIRRERIKKMKENPYLNALQIKFAYAITCHKAQGGQWCSVFLDQGYITEDMVNEEYLRWLYTAFTRATEKLYLINWPNSD